MKANSAILQADDAVSRNGITRRKHTAIPTRVKVAAVAAALALGTVGALSATQAQAAGAATCSGYACAKIYSSLAQSSVVLADANIGFTCHCELSCDGYVLNSTNTKYPTGAGDKFGVERCQVYAITAWSVPTTARGPRPAS